MENAQETTRKEKRVDYTNGLPVHDYHDNPEFVVIIGRRGL